MSLIFSRPISFRATNTLLGLRSRWTIPAPVSVCERVADVSADVNRLRDGQAAARGENAVERTSFEHFEDQIRAVLAANPGIQDLDEPRVADDCQGVRFAEQTRSSLLELPTRVVQKLQRDDLTREPVIRLEDEAHFRAPASLRSS